MSPAPSRLRRIQIALTLLVLGLVVALRLPALVGVRSTSSVEAASAAGMIAVFLFLVPLPLAGLGELLLPRRLGTPRLALGWLQKLSFAFWAAAAGLFTLGLALRDPATLHPRWLLLESYSVTQVESWVSWVLAGVFFVAAAAATSALPVLVSVHRRRRAGLRLRDVSVAVWALYGRALSVAIGAPLLAAFALLTLAERTLGLGIFDATTGGDPLVHRHLFWLALHPLLLTAPLPALGLVFETIAGRPDAAATPRQRNAFVAFALLAPLGWGQHLVASGVSVYAAMIFSAWALLGLGPLVLALVDAVRRVGGLLEAPRPAAAAALGLLAAALAFLAVALRAGSLATSTGLDAVLFGGLGLGLLVALMGGALGLAWALERTPSEASALEPAPAE
ncbi:MAG: cbb3-type cytochrome c oxidase subunit I [Myxococcota bacterium]